MTTLMVAFALAVATTGSHSAAEQGDKQKAEPPPHQVVAIYFHRTQRCPTCKRIGTLTKEAITSSFPEELKQRAVLFRMIDFQDEKNAKLVEQYKIKGPTLVLANVFDGEVVLWTPKPKVWQLVAKPDNLRKYVQEGVATYLKQTREIATAKAKERQRND